MLEVAARLAPVIDARTILAQGFDALAGQPRDAIDAVLTRPDGVREQVARWLSPEAAKPNGVDPICRLEPRGREMV